MCLVGLEGSAVLCSSAAFALLIRACVRGLVKRSLFSDDSTSGSGNGAVEGVSMWMLKSLSYYMML